MSGIHILPMSDHCIVVSNIYQNEWFRSLFFKKKKSGETEHRAPSPDPSLIFLGLRARFELRFGLRPKLSIEKLGMTPE